MRGRYKEVDKVYIYLLTFDVDSDVCYIGQTSDLRRRYQQHQSKSLLEVRNPRNNWLAKHLARGEVLIMEVVEVCGSRDAANVREDFWIREFRAAGFQLKNLTQGGTGFIALRRTEEHRRRISESLKRRWKSSPQRWDGLKNRAPMARTPKQRAQWAQVLEASRGRPKSPETRQRMSAAQRARWDALSPEEQARLLARRKEGAAKRPPPMLGKKNSPETVQRRVAKLAKHYHLISPEGQCVHVVNMAEFARVHHLDKRNLHALTTGKQKSYKGWRLDPARPQGYKPGGER